MKNIIRWALAVALVSFGSAGWGQNRYDHFGPVTGVLKGSATSYYTTAATSSDIRALWSGTCDATTFLRGDGACAAVSGTGTVTSVGLTTPAWLTVTGSPVTSSGTLSVSATGGLTANQFLATPNSIAGAASLRSIVGNDLPPINLSSTANGGVLNTSILLGTNGGTSNGFFSVTGPATALKTFTFPNASATILTSNSAVTVSQGGTGLGTLTAHGLLLGEGTSNLSNVAAMAADTLLQGQGVTSDPAAVAINNCGSGTTALSYSTSTHTFGCQTITSGGTGTVTSITGGTGITASPNPIVSTGTLTVDQGFSPAWTGTQTFSQAQGSTRFALSGPNTGVGWNMVFTDTTNSVTRGFIGIGTNTVGSAAVTDFAISPGASGSVVIGTASGGAIGTRFGPNGNVTINAPSSGIPSTTNVTRTSGTNAVVSVLADNVTGAQTPGFGTRLQGSTNSGAAISAIGFETGGVGNNNESQLSFYTQLSNAGGLLQRVLIGAAGNVTVNAPSSGTALTATAVSGAFALQSQGSGSALNAVFNGGSVATGNIESSDSGRTNKYTFGRDNASTGNWVLAFNGTELQHITSAGSEVIDAPSSVVAALSITGASNAFAQTITAGSTANQAFGLIISAGSSSSDQALLVRNQSTSTNFLQIFGDGGIVVGAPTGGDKGVGTVNAQSIFVQNVPVLTTSGNAATASALASTPTQCSGGQFATGIAASGNANCSTPPAGIQNVAYSGVSSAGALTNNKNMTLFSHSTSSGIYNLSVSGFSATPMCTTSIGGGGSAQYVLASSSSTTIQVGTYDTAGALSDSAFTVVCVQ